MKASDKKSLLLKNAMLWLVAMIVPAILSIALAHTKFPWQIIVPLLLVGPMLASNKIIDQACGDSQS